MAGITTESSTAACQHTAIILRHEGNSTSDIYYLEQMSCLATVEIEEGSKKVNEESSNGVYNLLIPKNFLYRDHL